MQTVSTIGLDIAKSVLTWDISQPRHAGLRKQRFPCWVRIAPISWRPI